MECKERRKINAQTCAPSVERFKDYPNLIPLSSKARDAKPSNGRNGKHVFERLPSKISLSGGSTSSPTNGVTSEEKLQPDCLAVKFICQFATEPTENNSRHGAAADVSNVGYRGERIFGKFLPPCAQDAKSNALALPPFSKPASLKDTQRHATSISAYACQHKMEVPPKLKDGNNRSQLLMEEHLPDMEPCMKAEAKSNTKVNAQSARNFSIQSYPVKSESNRGNPKPPVGIAFAQKRQQHLATSTKPSRVVKNVSSDFDTRYHQHALTQERELFLRENIEHSKYTPRLSAELSNPELQMPKLSTALQPGPMWDRDALMSLLQYWQLQQQSSAIAGGLQHSWLGAGMPPTCQLPGTRNSGVDLFRSSLLGSTSPGGPMVTPHFLQEPGAYSSWQSLATLYGNLEAASRELQNPFHFYMTHRLASLQHHELQALQEQDMLHCRIPFPLCKSNASLSADHCGLSQHSPKQWTRDSKNERCLSPPSFRPALPQNLEKKTLHNWSWPDCHRLSPAHSLTAQAMPPLSAAAEFCATPPSFCKDFQHIETSEKDFGVKPTRQWNEEKTNVIPEARNLDVASSFRDVSSVQLCPKGEKDDAVSKTASIQSSTPRHLLRDDSERTGRNGNRDGIPENTNHMHSTKADNQLDENMQCDRIEKCLDLSRPSESFGVELLSKAVDIHLQKSGTNQPASKPKSPENFSSNSIKLATNLYCCPEKAAFKEVAALRTAKEKNSLPENLHAANSSVNILTVDPDVLNAVQGITLLNQSASRNVGKRSSVLLSPNSNDQSCCHIQPLTTSVCGDSASVQSAISFAFVEGVAKDCLSSNETKGGEGRKKIRLKRRLKKPNLSTKLKLSNEKKATAGLSFVDVEARETDMKMKLANLQMQYKEKQKELAKIERRSRRLKRESHTSKSTALSASTVNAASHFALPEFKSEEMTALLESEHTSKKNTTPEKHPISQATLALEQRDSLSKDKEDDILEDHHPLTHKAGTGTKAMQEQDDVKSIFERIVCEMSPVKDMNEELPSLKNMHGAVLSAEQQSIPLGRRKRKLDKPKRICLASEAQVPTEPLVEPKKKTLHVCDNVFEGQTSNSDHTTVEKKRKMEPATVKIFLSKNNLAGEWVFKSKSKSEKHSGRARQRSKDKRKSESRISGNGNPTDGKKLKESESALLKDKSDSVDLSNKAQKTDVKENSKTPLLELKEEDLVKGLQVLVPLEDKLLYLCQVNPIQPPDIYELTVEGERSRHRPIVMCLEQILNEAVPDVKPTSPRDVCEGSRVAAYWSRKMHCLYTGTVVFDDSDEKDGEVGLIRVEFDDGDSNTIPLEDIRLLPANYPLVLSDAPFLMPFVHRRRNTLDMSSKGKSEAAANVGKKPAPAKKKERAIKISEKPSSKLRNSSLDSSIHFSLDSNPMPRKRAASSKLERETNEQNESSSSADDDSDALFSDSDDTFDEDGDVMASIVPSHGKGRQKIYRLANRLWSWHDKGVQKKAAKGKAKKIYHKSIERGKEVLSCGDSAVFLSPGRPHLSYIGRIEAMWESWGDNMVVKVRWFYHPEETKTGRLKSHGKHPLYKSYHIDENDIQTISHKCEVVSLKEYTRRLRNGDRNVFYCTGTYDPASGQVIHEHVAKKKLRKS